MKKNSPFTIFLILIIAATAVWYLYPSVIFYSQSPQKRADIVKNNPDFLKKVINLGLDLQGGMHLVLEVDRTNLTKKQQVGLLDRAYTVLENRVNGLGVAEPSIQKQGDSRLIVELPGLKDADAAKKVIGSTAQLEFKLVREPEEFDKAARVIEAVLKGKTKKLSADSSDVATDSAKVEAEKQKMAEEMFAGDEGSTEDSSAEKGADEEETTSEISFIDNLVKINRETNAVLEKNRSKVQEILERKDIQDALTRAGLGGSMFLWDHSKERLNNKEYRALYFLKKRSELKGDIISDAQMDMGRSGLSAGQALVSLEMNRKGARKFARVTGANVKKLLAIVLDSTVYSAPRIQQKISGGRAQITGNFTTEEAKNLAIVLRAGALPAPVKIIEERTVGPSLGQDSIKKAEIAGLLGFILVIIFMAVYYGVSGLIADLALILNVIFVMAIMASIGSTLTLPGVAGLILTMGMSVDANVIIFERIREELRLGKTIRSAVEAGYSRAFVTIMDANITTLFTAFILMYVGTGPIRGFAVTMILGIIVSLFTALYLTKVIFNYITSSKNLKKLSI